jgi:hypothetical protein
MPFISMLPWLATKSEPFVLWLQLSLPYASSVSQPFFLLNLQWNEVGAYAVFFIVVVLIQCQRCQCNEVCQCNYQLGFITWCLFCYLNALCRPITDLVLILINTRNVILCFNKLNVALMLPYNDEFCCCLLIAASAPDMDFYYRIAAWLEIYFMNSLF